MRSISPWRRFIDGKLLHQIALSTAEGTAEELTRYIRFDSKPEVRAVLYAWVRKVVETYAWNMAAAELKSLRSAGLSADQASAPLRCRGVCACGRRLVAATAPCRLHHDG